MTVSPTTLSPDILGCPRECPFLGMRTFMPQTLPFYCNKYETFLGADQAQRVCRCAQCRGVDQSITETGLSLIASYMTDHFTIEETKRVFLQLDPRFQKMFVDLVAQTGVQIILGSDDDKKPETLEDKILLARQDWKNRIGSPQAQEFKGLLDADGMPLMSRQTKTLLMNLFLVMDASEKEMMKNIMLNPKQADSFLNTFKRQPQDQDLLKNVRAVVYEYDRNGRELERLRQREREQNREQNRRQRNLQLLQMQRQRKRT